MLCNENRIQVMAQHWANHHFANFIFLSSLMSLPPLGVLIIEMTMMIKTHTSHLLSLRNSRHHQALCSSLGGGDRFLDFPLKLQVFLQIF